MWKHFFAKQKSAAEVD